MKSNNITADKGIAQHRIVIMFHIFPLCVDDMCVQEEKAWLQTCGVKDVIRYWYNTSLSRQGAKKVLIACKSEYVFNCYNTDFIYILEDRTYESLCKTLDPTGC